MDEKTKEKIVAGLKLSGGLLAIGAASLAWVSIADKLRRSTKSQYLKLREED